MTLVALEPGRYELGPLRDLLEERGSGDFFGDVGGITAATWERWVREGLTTPEASAAAGAAGVLVVALWPEWRPEAETGPDDARARIRGLRDQLEAS